VLMVNPNTSRASSARPSLASNRRDRLFELVKQIPLGKVTSYKALGLAMEIHPRVVGRLLHSNDDPDHVPCHRVVHLDGRLAEGYAFGGLSIQRQLLEAEGVRFDKRGYVGQEYFL
jgi:methylated-DNA-protein-cysteine methyltransferase related protein